MPVKDYTVMAEYPLSAGQLHKIAETHGKTLYRSGESFAVRFLLKSSFKTKSKYVVNNFIMQIIAVGKDGTFTPEEISGKIKVQKETIIKEKIVKVKPRA